MKKIEEGKQYIYRGSGRYYDQERIVVECISKEPSWGGFYSFRIVKILKTHPYNVKKVDSYIETTKKYIEYLPEDINPLIKEIL